MSLKQYDVSTEESFAPTEYEKAVLVEDLRKFLTSRQASGKPPNIDVQLLEWISKVKLNKTLIDITEREAEIAKMTFDTGFEKGVESRNKELLAELNTSLPSDGSEQAFPLRESSPAKEADEQKGVKK